MDIATLIGTLLCAALVVGTIMMNDKITTFINVPSIALVVGGTIAALLMCFPLGKILKIFAVLRKAFFSEPAEPVAHVTTLVRLAEVARRDGILSLENHLADGEFDDFMVRGLRMAIDGQDPSVIQAAMEQEVETLMERHASGKAIFDNGGKYAPAFGMLGTIMGLIVMLRNMDDPAALGPGMAVALITTFYGSLLANTVFLPLADKLGSRSTEEVAGKLLIIRGVMSIQSGDNPRIVQQKLLAFLDATQREQATASDG
jgi:chemotaxis protein MotA